MKTRSEIMEWRRAQRTLLQERRRALGREEREESTARIAGLLERYVPELADATVGFYWPFKGEMDLRGLAGSLHAAGSRLGLPVVVQKAAPLEFWHWEPATRLARGDWGIPVPAERVVVQPTALIVPLLGFDEAGYRLGYGGGYYDRTLAATTPRPFTVGAGFELGRLTSIHPLEHDIPLDAIVTEKGIVRYDAERRPVATARDRSTEGAPAQRAARPSD